MMLQFLERVAQEAMAQWTCLWPGFESRQWQIAKYQQICSFPLEWAKKWNWK